MGRGRPTSTRGDGLTRGCVEGPSTRTRNIVCMSLTRDVLKLNFWLNAFVSCRGGGANDVLTDVVYEKRDGVLGDLARAHEERTRNIPCMLVTLDVSKLSG